MARTRSINDEQILQRVGDALGDVDNTWTLTGAAAAAGLHPATLIKRFGSRRGLLVALSERWLNSIPSEPTSGDAHQELLVWVEATAAGEATVERAHAGARGMPGVLTLLDGRDATRCNPGADERLGVVWQAPQPLRRTHDHLAGRPAHR